MKKGFTLIELMVVIVIIGILAAIAVPKMFGMSAKAKAAEVMPAWGSWSKVAQAYALETSGVGNFVSIGFTPPNTADLVNFSGTTNFTFAGGVSGTAPYNTSADRGLFNATNKVKLNNCALHNSGANYTTVASLNAASATTWVSTFNTSGTIQAWNPTDSECAILTPTFKN